MKLSFQTNVQLLTLAFLTFAITLAHAATPDTDTIYTVQLGVFKDDMTIADFEDIRNVGYLYAETLSRGNQMSVFISNYKSRSKAEGVLSYVKSKGYEDAFISERPLVKGVMTHVVQLASQVDTDYINWKTYARGGQLYLILEGKQLKITSVPFRDLEKAKEKARILENLGFKGAFVKSVNTLALHKVTQFNTVKEIDFTPQAISIDIANNTEGVTAVNGTETATVFPTKETVDMSPKAPTQISRESRLSVKSFQQFLKSQNAYNSSLDGVYGKGTATGIAQLEANNRQYNRYKALSVEVPRLNNEEAITELDAILLSIPSDPKNAYSALTQKNSPIAKAYRAYILFIADHDNNQDKINGLMNAAIKEAYAGFNGKAPFDYNATYAYNNLEQLILHTRYVQAALKEEPITPCWLFIKHKEEAYSAFGNLLEKSLEDFRMQGCSGFMEWDNIILLKTISTDLNPNEDHLTNEQLKLERIYSSKRNKLYLIPRALNTDQENKIVEWNDQLWASLDLKIAEDKFFAKFGVPFKLAYHKSWIQLEDYYIEKGFKKYQANALALSVIQSIVGVDIEPYLK